jgi:hypothetical protein
LSKANSKHISPGEKNITDAAYVASALDEAFIEKMKSDPHQWNRFLQKGRALYALSRALSDIGTS